MPVNPENSAYSGYVFTWAFLAFLVGERLFELRLARRNAVQARARGAVEHGRGLTRVIVAFHAAWLLAFVVEAGLGGKNSLLGPLPTAAVMATLQALRYWCVLTLGPRWNTRVLVVPGAAPVRSGPYRFLRHPNYLVVLLEIALYPALFGCWLTALGFGSLNALLLAGRIRTENRALRALRMR